MSGQLSQNAPIQKDQFIKNLIELISEASRPLTAAELPLQYRARFGTVLNRALISALDPSWTGLHALMQSSELKEAVAVLWDSHKHPVYAASAHLHKLDLTGLNRENPAEPRELGSGDVPGWLQEHQTELVFSYDVKRWPFQEIWKTLLQAPDLRLLHSQPMATLPPLCPTLTLAHKALCHDLPDAWQEALTLPATRKQTALLRAHPEYKRLLKLLHSFLLEVVLPLCGDPSGLWYQCRPTLRIHMPSAPATEPQRERTAPGHSAAEIAFYVPLTPSEGSNALHAESAPDQGDFHPLVADYGQAVRFNAAGCRHHVLRNETESTRVSLDFRIIPNAAFKAHAAGDHIGHHRAVYAGPDPPEPDRPGAKRKRAEGSAEDSLTAADLGEGEGDEDDEEE
eukprot:EG_transcript_14259